MDTTPDANDLWSGIGGHFDSLTQIICEFIDNSISNFQSTTQAIPKTISVTLTEDNQAEYVVITIEDTGTGITNFEPVLRLGDKSVRQTPFNEHGFGMKHALASANPSNDNWEIYTRTLSEFQNGNYRVVNSQYRFNQNEQIKQLSTEQWPGSFNGSGTFIRFSCTKEMFNTVQKGIKGRAEFNRCLDYLREDLGFIYASLIQKGLCPLDVNGIPVKAVLPTIVGNYPPTSKGAQSISRDLGAGSVDVDYLFCEMDESPHIKYYKKNIETSGVELRINGRLMEYNVFKDIWELENHPSYNHFLVLIDIHSDDRTRLPITRTSKNGIRSGDERLSNLFKWIRSVHPNPQKKLSGAVAEGELVDKLIELKQVHITNAGKRIIKNFDTWKQDSHPVKADLYIFDGTRTILYEAKKDNANLQDLYQLLMYWDGAVADGLQPNEGVLIASSFSSLVPNVIASLNQKQDINGKNYNFTTTTWKTQGVQYPD